MVELREFDVEAEEGDTVRWIMGGKCSMVGSALTYVPIEYITEVDAHRVRSLPLSALLQQLYEAFEDEDDEDEDDDDEDDDSDDEDDEEEPRRSKRARHGVDRLGAFVK